jgi:hypothetical protein
MSMLVTGPSANTVRSDALTIFMVSISFERAMGRRAVG